MAIRRMTFKRIRREMRYYKALLKDPRTPRAARWCIAAGIGYLLLPIDLIPDFIPLLGQIDDVIVVTILVGIGVLMVPHSVKVDVRHRTQPIRTRHASPESPEFCETEALPSRYGVRIRFADVGNQILTDEEVLHALLRLVFEHHVVVVDKAIGRLLFAPHCGAPGRAIAFGSELTPLRDFPDCLPILHTDDALTGTEEGRFVDMVAAYEGLSPSVKRQIGSLRIRYQTRPGAEMDRVYESRNDLISVKTRCLVLTHPVTQQKVLSPLFYDSEIVGMPRKEGTDLLGSLRAHADQSEFYYQDLYDPAEIVISDAATTQHPMIWGESTSRKFMNPGSWSQPSGIASNTQRGGEVNDSYRLLLRAYVHGSRSTEMNYSSHGGA